MTSASTHYPFLAGTFKPIICGIAFMVLFATQYNAQAQQGEITFSVITLSDLPYENLYFRSGKDAVKIDIRNSRRSKPQLVKAAEFFQVYTDSDIPEERYKLVGKGKFPLGASKALFFLRKSTSSEKTDLPIELFGIDDSTAKFPKGSFRFANFMEAQLNIYIGKEAFRIRPKEFKVQKISLSKDGEFTPFLVKDLNGDTLGGTRLFSHASNREMVLVFPPAKGKKRLDIRYFSD